MVKVLDVEARSGDKTGSNAVVTIPNIITAVRFLIAPLFAYVLLAQENYAFATCLLILLGASDWVDGYLARRLGQVSAIGKILDPVADRLSLIVVFAALTIAEVIPWFVIVGIATVDAILAVTSLLRFEETSGLKVTFIGKTRTALLMAGVLLIMGSLTLRTENTALTLCAYGIFYSGCLGHLWAGIGYFFAVAGKKTVLKKNNDIVAASLGETTPRDN